MTTSPSAFAPFVRQKTVLLTTYRRDGTATRTPVHIVVEGGSAFFRTYDKTWKSKRIRNNPRVSVCPSTIRGRPTGPEVEAEARLLSGEEAEHARRLMVGKYRVVHGLVVPLAHRLRRYETLHYELTVPRAR